MLPETCKINSSYMKRGSGKNASIQHGKIPSNDPEKADFELNSSWTGTGLEKRLENMLF